MDPLKYDLSANADFTVFEFTSTGKNGTIHKAIKYTQTLNANVFNLGFGDIIFSDDTITEIDDTNLSNNGDLNSIIATVVHSAYIFTEKYPDAYILFGSSDTAKLRLYRMFLSHNLAAISKSFLVFGAMHNEQGQLVNVPFSAAEDIIGYFGRRK
ncbi:hypothetical protein R1T16_00640 [Flavobacterium sp. DG1-102-2]|uniref:DUF6934 family protein n=1 Tax=Flavobacterium sp. DG1-102-2 TaxID=3081663 RepID=UPI002949B2A8|nr:hypothetical protein [Flavobacterium sp. DG1-102-2]MDV6166912.1 hypothetical protein [Flavobacterium sp. DG1-102-2]